MLTALSSNPELQKKKKGNDRPLYEPVKVREATPEEFLEATKKAKERHRYGAFVAKHWVEEYANMQTLLISENGLSGIAITKDGDIENVFSIDSNSNGAVYTLVMLAIENGGVKGDNFDGLLTLLYASMGAIPVAKIAFKREFAPQDWNYERDGKKEIIFWMLNGEPANVVAAKIKTYPSPDTSSLPLFDSYDEAAAYRDRLLQERIERQNPSPTKKVIPLQNGNQKTSITSILTKEGDIDYEQLTTAANAVENGVLYLNGLSLEETTGSLRGGRTHIEASLLLAADERASREEQAATGEDAIKRIAASQEEVLEMYAREKDKWIPASEIEKWVLLDYGMESKAYKDPDDDTYIIKVMHNYKIFSKTPMEFLDNRITLHNYIFPDAAYELVGFSKVKGDRYEDPAPRLAFIVRQQYVPGREITEADRPLLDQEMIKYGFQRIEGTDSYANSDYRVGDLHVRNVMITDGGNFRFIDTVSILNTPGLGLGGTREYGPRDLVPTGKTPLPLSTDSIITNNNINYGQLKKATDAIERDKAYLNRLSPTEERGRVEGNRENVSASLLLAAKERAGSQERRDARQGTDSERAKVQEQLLKKYARENNLWFDPEEIDSWEYITSGMEARVYNDPDSKYVLKVVYNYKNFTPTPLEYLDNRISLYNHLFGNSGSKIELVGFTETYGATRDVKGPFFAFVIRQVHVQGRELAEEEIPLLDKEMKQRGFDKKGDVYYNDDYIVKDLHADNVIIDNNGNLFFIDPSIALNTPDEDFGGTREYGNGELVLIEPPTRQDLLKQLLREQFPNYNTGFINAYYNAATQANIALMSLYFKDYGKFFVILSKMVTKEFIEKGMPDNLFDHLVDEYAMFYLSRFPFFNREDAREFLQNFPGDLQEQLDESPYLAGLELFKHVRVEGGRIAAAGLSYVDAQVKEKLTLDWEQLYTGEHRQLAVDLYRLIRKKRGTLPDVPHQIMSKRQSLDAYGVYCYSVISSSSSGTVEEDLRRPFSTASMCL
ncbi:MAG: hypothetical protein LBG30_02425 [Odoribacteraceae bacterium]|nr:hypothetical protein [Odoribacteraceae bacterium]